ncbi:uncharacterized protein LOC135476781 [Liolophura sinensis]|uniref:uncharacterized protein LOC135476781 n=1 Tax=Liolophura sinensis TaxID=3198878 RepID=UPI00315840C4
MIHTVMCRTRGRNCDMVAYREVTRLCSGRQYCLSADMWLISGKYCERNDRRAFLSIAIVSYMCVSAHAVESNCSQRGFRVSRDQRYLSSPGYPALVTGNSMCSWKLYPPHGYKVDIYVREYLHRDDTGQQYLRIKELAKNGQSLQLDSTAKRELTSTLSGEVELLLVTDGSTKGHRMWVEYRYVPEESLEHLRPFPVPNKTECGSVLLNKTSFPGLRPRPGFGSSTIPTSSPTLSKPSSTLTTLYEKSTRHKDFTNPFFTSTRTSPGVNSTDVHKGDGPSTAITVAIAVCAIGLACCIAAIWATCRHRRKKATANSRNCLATDTYSVEYDRASLNSTPSSHPYSRPSPLVTAPRQHHALGMVDIVRQSEMVHLKSGYHSPPETIMEVAQTPDMDTSAMTERDGQAADTLDLSKYLITDSENPPCTLSKTSKQSNERSV